MSIHKDKRSAKGPSYKQDNIIGLKRTDIVISPYVSPSHERCNSLDGLYWIVAVSAIVDLVI